jgi:hypothetical protein
MVGAIVVLVLLAVGGLFLKPAVPEPAATATGPTPTARATPPVTSNPAPPKTQEPARQAPPDSTPATSAGQAKSTAQAADEAFTKLQYFEGLAPDDRDGRIRQIEEFLAKYGQEIVASRARVMLSELNAPPPTPEPARIQTTTPPPAEPAPPPSTEGWKAVSGPFTFEDGQVNRWDGDLGSRVEAGEFEGRKCLRLRPGDQRNCRAFRGPSMDSAGVRVRFRYFAHDVEYVEVLWAQGSHRPRKHIEPLVRDGWAEVCFTGVELGGNATRLGHIEIGGPAKSGESFLLLDDVVWEKQ